MLGTLRTNMIAYLIIAVEITVLFVAVLPAVRVITKPAVRRECRENPLIALALALAVIIAGVALFWCLTHSAQSRLVVVLIAATLWLIGYLHGRPQYGKGRGLPPGSLGFGTSLDAITQPDFYAAAEQRWGPVFKMSQWHRPVACVTDLRLAGEFLREQADAVRQVNWSFDRLVPGGYIEFMNGDRHAHYRELFRPGFGESVLAACRADFLAVICTNLQGLASASTGSDVDPVPWLEQIALDTVLRVVLGIRHGDARAAEFPGWLTRLDPPIGLAAPVPRSARQAFRHLAGAVRDLSRDQALPSVLAELQAAGPGAVQDEVVIGNLVTMVQDGRNILRRLLHWILKLSADQPAWTLSGGEEAAGASDTLARNVVLETLRLEMTPYIYRRVISDCHLGGYLVPKGWLVRFCLREAHRRPDVFAQPDRFAPSRFAGRDYGPEVFWPFSVGAHTCLADRFSIAVAEMFVVELTRNYRVRVTKDAPPERANRHWAYWTPSRRLRIRLDPTAADLHPPTRPD